MDEAPIPSRPDEYRAGFVSFLGRPNVGKSTLMNAIVGQKVAITSDRPQTTRRAIRGIVTRDDGQLVIVDLPGVHRPRTLLGERLNDLVLSTLGEVDVIGFCVPAGERIGPGDRFIDSQLDAFPRAKKVAIVTKIDASSRGRVLEQLAEVGQLRDWDAVVPVSAADGSQLSVLVGELLALLPVSPQLYPSETATDETAEARIAEVVREAALAGAREELPHSLAVTIDELSERDRDPAHPERRLIDVFAKVHVERDSQKGIVIGRGGTNLRSIGERARPEIEALVGARVNLQLQVVVAKDWQRDPKQLGRLGF